MATSTSSSRPASGPPAARGVTAAAGRQMTIRSPAGARGVARRRQGPRPRTAVGGAEPRSVDGDGVTGGDQHHQQHHYNTTANNHRTSNAQHRQHQQNTNNKHQHEHTVTIRAAADALQPLHELQPTTNTTKHKQQLHQQQNLQQQIDHHVLQPLHELQFLLRRARACAIETRAPRGFRATSRIAVEKKMCAIPYRTTSQPLHSPPP